MCIPVCFCVYLPVSSWKFKTDSQSNRVAEAAEGRRSARIHWPMGITFDFLHQTMNDSTLSCERFRIIIGPGNEIANFQEKFSIFQGNFKILCHFIQIIFHIELTPTRMKSRPNINIIIKSAKISMHPRVFQEFRSTSTPLPRAHEREMAIFAWAISTFSWQFPKASPYFTIETSKYQWILDIDDSHIRFEPTFSIRTNNRETSLSSFPSTITLWLCFAHRCARVCTCVHTQATHPRDDSGNTHNRHIYL